MARYVLSVVFVLTQPKASIAVFVPTLYSEHLSSIYHDVDFAKLMALVQPFSLCSQGR